MGNSCTKNYYIKVQDAIFLLIKSIFYLSKIVETCNSRLRLFLLYYIPHAGNLKLIKKLMHLQCI